MIVPALDWRPDLGPVADKPDGTVISVTNAVPHPQGFMRGASGTLLQTSANLGSTGRGVFRTTTPNGILRKWPV